MQVTAIRILPPIAVGRLGSSPRPLEAFTLEVSQENPLDFRKIAPKNSFTVDMLTGKVRKHLPEKIVFKDADNLNDRHGTVRPVAPFLEVFVETDENPGVLVPLTTTLLEQAGLSVENISWSVRVGNIKLFRRTQNEKDKITAVINNITTHERMQLEGKCENFLPGKILPLGYVQFIAPDEDFPQIRFRFTPGPGRVYGAKKERVKTEGQDPVKDPLFVKYGEDFLLYSEDGDWAKYEEGNQELPILTNPGAIFAGFDGVDKNNVPVRKSWGYLDDECDGTITVSAKNCE